MDFDNPKVYGDTSITDGLAHLVTQLTFLEAIMALSVCYWNLETTSPDSPGGPGGPGGQDGQPLWSALRKYVVYMV